MAMRKNIGSTDAWQWHSGPMDWEDVPTVKAALEAWSAGARVDFEVSEDLFFDLLDCRGTDDDFFTFSAGQVRLKGWDTRDNEQRKQLATERAAGDLDFPITLSRAARWYCFANVYTACSMPDYVPKVLVAKDYDVARSILQGVVEMAEVALAEAESKLEATPSKPAARLLGARKDVEHLRRCLRAAQACLEALNTAERVARSPGGGGIVVQFQGRDAVPVRALPFITNWDLSPEPLAELLNDTSARWHTDSVKQSPPWLTAYQLLPGGHFRKIEPREWDQVVVALKGFDSRLNATEYDEHDGYAQWRKDAMTHFPAGCFVWRDEFEASANHQNKVYWPDPDEAGGFYPVSTDGWVKSLKAWSLASSLRWMSGLWNRSM